MKKSITQKRIFYTVLIPILLLFAIKIPHIHAAQLATLPKPQLPIAPYNDDQRDVLTFGYLREQVSALNINVPYEIQELITQFLQRDRDPQNWVCLRILNGHTKGVFSVSWSHDSTRLASGSWDKSARIWNAHTGECLRILSGHTKVVKSVSWSHDSTRLASGSWDNSIKIWNVHTGVCLYTLNGHEGWVKSVSWSHDSNYLASGSYDNTIKVWNAETGNCLNTLHGHTNLVNSVSWSHDSNYLASGSWDNSIKIWGGPE